MVHQGFLRELDAFQIPTWDYTDPLHPGWVPAPLSHRPFYQQHRSQHEDIPKVLVVLTYTELTFDYLMIQSPDFWAWEDCSELHDHALTPCTAYLQQVPA